MLRRGCKILVGKPEGKTALGRPRRRYADNIEADIREVVLDSMDCINLAKTGVGGGIV
jgi:hypothetical protein